MKAFALACLLVLAAPASAADVPYGYAVVYNKAGRWAQTDLGRVWLGPSAEGYVSEFNDSPVGPTITWTLALSGPPKWIILCCPQEKHVPLSSYVGPVWEHGE